MEKWIDRAIAFGFTKACVLNCDTLDFRSEVRDMCESNLCGKYGRYWVCPPACGSLEDCAKRASEYQKGLIVEFIGTTDDPFDIEGMLAIGERHRRLFSAFALELREVWPAVLPLSAGSCTFCESCTYPNAPCRFPHLAAPSMEAFGLLVSDVCAANHIPYYHGEGSITYIGCYLLE